MEITKDKRKNLHEGHRKRLLEQIYKSGLENMTEVQILEFVLTFFIPRKDTNELAHILLNEFGSLKNVLDASENDLLKIEGIGARSAKLLTLLPKIFFHYRESGYKNKPIYINNLSEAVDFLTDILSCKPAEELYILFFTADQQLIKFEKCASGSQNDVSFNCPDIVNKVVKYNPNFIIIAHNHPNGYPFPSNNDISTTNKIMKMLYYHQITVMDHIIIGKDSYYSFSENYLISDIYNKHEADEDKFESDILQKAKNPTGPNGWLCAKLTKFDKNKN